MKCARRIGPNNWATETVDKTPNSVSGLYTTSIAITPVTKGVGISYAYFNSTGRSVKYAWKNPGMAVFSTTFADRSVGTDGTSLAFDASGNPCIAYHVAWGESDLKYTKHTGTMSSGTWNYKTFPTAVPDGYDPSLVLSNGGYPRISSRIMASGWSPNNVTFTWENTSKVWNTQTVAVGGYQYNFDYSSIAIYRATGKTGICYMSERLFSGTWKYPSTSWRRPTRSTEEVGSRSVVGACTAPTLHISYAATAGLEQHVCIHVLRVPGH